jgi:hypothetical protein
MRGDVGKALADASADDAQLLLSLLVWCGRTSAPIRGSWTSGCDGRRRGPAKGETPKLRPRSEVRPCGDGGFAACWGRVAA